MIPMQEVIKGIRKFPKLEEWVKKHFKVGELEQIDEQWYYNLTYYLTQELRNDKSGDE